MTSRTVSRPDAVPPRSARRRIASRLLALGLTGSAAAHGATLTVGAPGGGCDHATIQAAVDDARTRPGADVIRVTRSQVYAAQDIVIADPEALTLEGGYADCTASVADTIPTELSGAGGRPTSVITVEASAPAIVTLQRLRISGGDAPDGDDGGGIRFEGSGELRVTASIVDENRAGDGGGIAFFGDGSAPRLTIGRDTLVAENVAAHRGGGIHVSGARFDMHQPGSSLARNRARLGGGLYVQARAGYRTIAEVGASGFGTLGTIDGNRADAGGGILVQSVAGVAASDMTLTVASFDPLRPLRISRNVASVRGGGIALQSPASSNGVRDVFATLIQVALEGNSAPIAAALSVGDGADPEASGSASVRIVLNTIVANEALDAAGGATSGEIVHVASNNDIEIDRTRLHDNVGGPLLRSDGARIVTLTNSLLNDNAVAGSVLDLGLANPDFLTLQGVTIAGNALDASPVIRASGLLRMRTSILWQPGRVSLQAPAADVRDLLASEVASLGAEASVVMAEPRFIDPARRDYRLQAASPAVDFSATVAGADLDSGARGVDLDGVPNRFGAADLGAYERPALGNLVRNPGFVADLRLWDESAAGAAGHVASGAASPGAVRLSAPAPEPVRLGTLLVGLTQCIHVPSPGRYRLDGMAVGLGADAASRDRVSLRWRFRGDSGDERCAGGIDDAGIVEFPPSGAFAASIAPGVIDVPVAQWTQRSTIEIALQVDERGFLPGEATTGLFDDIVLERLADPLPEALFADGFE